MPGRENRMSVRLWGGWCLLHFALPFGTSCRVPSSVPDNFRWKILLDVVFALVH